MEEEEEEDMAQTLARNLNGYNQTNYVTECRLSRADAHSWDLSYAEDEHEGFPDVRLLNIGVISVIGRVG